MINSTTAATTTAAQYQAYTKNTQIKKAQTKEETAPVSAKEKAENCYKNLSDKAKKVLEQLKKKYSNMDFFVADTESDAESEEIMASGTKDFSVLFSSDELEKIANDEDALKADMDKIDQAVNMSKNLKEAFAADSENGVTADDISRVGIIFHDDGTTSYFAELERSSEKQKERIEASKEKKAQEKKEAQKAQQQERYAKKNGTVKKVSVEASSYEELVEKLKQVDWTKIQEEQEETVGKKIDYSV